MVDGGTTMKTLLTICFATLFAINLGTAQERGPEADDSKFAVQQGSTRAAVMGPDDVVSMVHIVEQPDSPAEVVSVDLGEMRIRVTGDRYSWSNCARVKVRNRSDRVIRRVALDLEFNVGGGFGAVSSSALRPGEEVQIKVCNGEGMGDRYLSP
jgi:hypothetical protein